MTAALILYAALWLAKSCLPDGPFRIGFTNGLMSERMILWFLSLLLWEMRKRYKQK